MQSIFIYTKKLYYQSYIASQIVFDIITRALAYAWRYKPMFERGQNAQQISKTEHKAERTIYKYLALAYLSPKIVADIMDGTAPAVDLQTLFAIAAKHTDFREQGKEFYGT